MTNSSKRIGGIAVAASLFLIGVWAMLVFRPQSSDLAKAHKEKAAAEQQVSQLQSQVASLRQIYAHIPADTARYATLSAAIPDNPGLSAAITQINDAATASGLQIKSVNPTAPAATTAGGAAAAAGTPAITVSIAASGTYEQAQSFLTQLAASPRVFVVNSISYAGGQSGPNGGNLTIQMGASIFYAGQPTP